MAHANPFDPAELSRCVLCGMCLSACPTHRELSQEMDSPRGRIALMRLLASGAIGPDSGATTHIDRCLGCLACEAVCPSGVRFGHLLEDARAYLEKTRPRPPLERFLLHVAFRHLLPYPARLHALALLLRLGQRVDFARPLALLSRLGLLPQAFSRLLAFLPPLPDTFFMHPPQQVFPSAGKPRHRVALFTGCIMPYLFPSAHEATVRLLQQNGCEVVVPQGQACCGALHLHNGFKAETEAMARRNIEAFEKSDAEAVILNSAGCGAALKEYARLLKHDSRYAHRAASFSHKVEELSRFLVSLPLEPPSTHVKGRATYQDPCHLVHAQRIRAEPRKLLRSIPGLEFIEMREADRCCGAAGVYNLLQPALSQKILDFKLRCLAETGATLVVTANPGCLLQLRVGAEQAGLRVEVLHLAELLDRAYRGDSAQTTLLRHKFR